MRLAYLDEAGISAKERTALVAAVIIDPDRHYGDLESIIEDLMIEHVDPDHWDAPFAFHAKDLLWGGKKGSAFPQKETDDEDRWQILEELLRIPRALQLPVIVGWYRKADPAKDSSIMAHAMAHSACAMGINFHLRKQEPNAWAMLIAEDRPEARSAIKQAHTMFREARLVAEETDDPLHQMGTHLREGVLFGAKDDALALQLADCVACIVRREIDGSKNNERFMQALFGGPIDMHEFEELQWGYERFFIQNASAS